MEESDGWRVLENGKEMVKRVGKSLLHKPIDLTSSEAQSPQNSDSSQQPGPADESTSATLDQQSGLGKSETHSSSTCDGPAVALLLRKFFEAFRDMPTLDNDPDVDHRRCDSCRPVALRAFKILENVLLPCAGDLENVGTHHYAGEDIDASHITDISPYKRRRTKDRSALFIEESSGED